MMKAGTILDGRREAAALYDRELGLEWLRKPTAPEGWVHSYQSYVCLVDKKAFGGDLREANIFRNALMGRLQERGIATRQGTHAVHTLGYYRKKYGIREDELPGALEADRLSMALPLYAGISADDQRYVIEHLSRLGPESIACAE